MQITCNLIPSLLSCIPVATSATIIFYVKTCLERLVELSRGQEASGDGGLRPGVVRRGGGGGAGADSLRSHVILHE